MADGAQSSWTDSQLDAITATNDFHVAPYREDGTTPGTPVWVWAVAVGDAVFVRSTNPASRWFAAAITQRAGRVSFGGWEGVVTYTLVTDTGTLDAVDAEFRRKYRDDAYLSEALLAGSRTQVAAIRPAAA
ncbi:DUF2255 family protein [Amycolatopsis sp. SID8362]|uniref:DUF2255 family protein n=1 Tax=Amycolatopsis sp. SID8362 TaxID=2690346 RepID=UPI00136A8B03|nr:DUF2255 family protein [Amycolatopsis sp. SID8362]NBH12133.1 DUF2255 family protein [Amycolatopsis sp. SID8362]NED48825.1 DUF2255 family protein [Amycolatopsis sp. SID8362]